MYQQIMETIYETRAQYSHEANEALKEVGKTAISGSPIVLMGNSPLVRAYYDKQAKISALNELLEKIANIPEDTEEVKHNPFCNDIIRDVQGNEVARAKEV